jgi:hypothetical protein
MPALHQVVVRPVVTEKSSAAYQTRREYTFEVHPEANKYQIRAALEKLFGVTVTPNSFWSASRIWNLLASGCTSKVYSFRV